ncbi:hypothetical protein CONPUDRAFT_80910 [Coniophora puteana RWD-64-598 SS2]|uniref:G-protein coupled receptors family 1 profile domain-containing protein n=1 Tax=Coniophora puteana (strain RWD-64-598) TaxID=741705 RepID=A0A5M3MVA4_CONPW|nr:uncharacterized protein CONPUDRAFT_80910 [Coniophora puteana RWD-64-598 SS2]EIW82645.1 hypothetical protein CONPUDRAFT_80910 [Coniophora puteana RWD-64-598 SS2]
MSYLFLLNRYLTPFGFIASFYAYLSPTFTHSVCDHFVKYENATIVVGVDIAGLMMLRRVTALYHDRILVAFIAGVLFAVWVCLTVVVVFNGYASSHTPAVHSCTEAIWLKPPGMAAASLWLGLLYETTVVCLVISRTLSFKPHRNTNTITRTLAKDGLMYYLVVVTINVVGSIMIYCAPAELKNVFGKSQLHLVVTMMSRITLNLPKQHRRMTGRGSHQPSRWEDAASLFPPINVSLRQGGSSPPDGSVMEMGMLLPNRPSRALRASLDPD